MIGVRHMQWERDFNLLQRARAHRLSRGKEEVYDENVAKIERRLGLR